MNQVTRDDYPRLPPLPSRVRVGRIWVRGFKVTCKQCRLSHVRGTLRGTVARSADGEVAVTACVECPCRQWIHMVMRYRETNGVLQLRVDDSETWTTLGDEDTHLFARPLWGGGAFLVADAVCMAVAIAALAVSPALQHPMGVLWVLAFARMMRERALTLAAD